MADKRSAYRLDRRRPDVLPRIFPEERNRADVRKVSRAAGSKTMPDMLAPMPIPILLKERAAPRRNVSFRESVTVKLSECRLLSGADRALYR